MAKIKQITASEILDSRGNPTIETTVLLSDNISVSASVPSGASLGTYEALELRDHDLSRFDGMGVKKAIENIENIIAPKLIGMDATKQAQIDQTMITMDGTQNKGKLGANAILSVSIAVCKAAAKSSLLPMFLYLRQFIKHENLALKIPTSLFNILNGGKHAGGNIDFQEFIIIPATSKSYADCLQIGTTVYKSLEKILLEKGLGVLVGDEGGFGPKLATNYDGFLLIKEAIEKTPYKLDFDVFFGLDAAANSFFTNKKYHLRDKSIDYATNDLISYYQELNKQYHLLYLEDGLSEDDWDGWTSLTTKLSQDTLIVGDDLTVTNPYRLQMAIDKKAITGIIIKPNQIGTVIETLAVVEVARAANLKIIVSHRSGETNDDFIADFAVAVSADYVKFGAPARGERVAKYDRLLQIEKQFQDLGSKL